RLELVLEGFKERSAKGENDPGYQAAAKELAAAREALAASLKRFRPATTEALRANYREDVRARKIVAEDKVGFLKNWEKVLLDDIERKTKAADNLKQGSIDVEWLQDEIAQVDTVTKDAARQLRMLEVETQAPQ